MTKGFYVYEYPRPMVTVDAVIYTVREGQLEVLLIKRGHDPFQGMWAVPGGFVEMEESLDAAAARELAEETGISGVTLEQFYTFGAPDRDPRGRLITVAYLGLIGPDDQLPRAADDAAAVVWFPVSELPRLACDHNEIVDVGVRHLQLMARIQGPSLCLCPSSLPFTKLKVALERHVPGTPHAGA